MSEQKSQDIRLKMLKYSRELSNKNAKNSAFENDFENSDEILRRRFEQNQSHGAEQKLNKNSSYFRDYKRKENIFLKENLIDIKLEKKAQKKKFFSNKNMKKKADEILPAEKKAIEIDDKNDLLSDFDKEISRYENLSFYNLLFAFLIIFGALLLFLPQIYIRNQIYYISRDIGELKTKENVLEEENKELKHRLEIMRFKNQILDYL